MDDGAGYGGPAREACGVGGGETVRERDLDQFFAQVFGCTAEVAAAASARAAVRGYPTRALILRQGDATGETVILILGRAHAVAYGADGQTALIQEFGPGDIFGALGDRDTAREADVVAAEPSRAAILLALDFLFLIETYAAVGLAVSRLLLRQLRAATERMAQQVMLSAAGRIYAELLRLAQLGDGRVIRPAPVLSALAVRVNSTRETVSRTVSALERRGLVRREDDALVLVAPARLREMVV